MNFLKKIFFSSTFLICSLLLFIYIYYQSEVKWNGEKKDYYYPYYLISLLLIFSSIVLFFINKKIKKYLIIISVSIVVSLYVIEAFLTYQELQFFIEREEFSKKQVKKKKLLDKKFLNKKKQLYKKKTGKEWNTSTKFEIYEELKKTNKLIKISIPPSINLKNNSQIFPLAGISNSKTIFCNENGYFAMYKSDRYGYNNPDYEWNNDEVEYLLVGDSFAHGACVNRPNDIGSILRSLTNSSVLNLGYGGNGPLIEYATLREYFKPNSKKILWIFFEGNDLKNLNNEIKNQILKNYINDLTFTQYLKFKQNEIDNLLNKFIEKEKIKKKEEVKKEIKLIEDRNYFNFNKFIKIYNLRKLIFLKFQPVPQKKLNYNFKKILELTKHFSKKNNSKFYFVYLPEYDRYKKFNYQNHNYNLIKQIVKELEISFIDIHKEVFEKEHNPLKLFPFELNNHYNIEGYRKVAEAIYRNSK